MVNSAIVGGFAFTLFVTVVALIVAAILLTILLNLCLRVLPLINFTWVDRNPHAHAHHTNHPYNVNNMFHYHEYRNPQRHTKLRVHWEQECPGRGRRDESYNHGHDSESDYHPRKNSL